MVMVQVADLSHENFKSSRIMRWWLSRLSSRSGAKSSRERKPKWLSGLGPEFFCIFICFWPYLFFHFFSQSGPVWELVSEYCSPCPWSGQSSKVNFQELLCQYFCWPTNSIPPVRMTVFLTCHYSGKYCIALDWWICFTIQSSFTGLTHTVEEILLRAG